MANAWGPAWQRLGDSLRGLRCGTSTVATVCVDFLAAAAHDACNKGGRLNSAYQVGTALGRLLIEAEVIGRQVCGGGWGEATLCQNHHFLG